LLRFFFLAFVFAMPFGEIVGLLRQHIGLLREEQGFLVRDAMILIEAFRSIA
jgi:hypothetical protein